MSMLGLLSITITSRQNQALPRTILLGGYMQELGFLGMHIEYWKSLPVARTHKPKPLNLARQTLNLKPTTCLGCMPKETSSAGQDGIVWYSMVVYSIV